jgi:transposase-like protein
MAGLIAKHHQDEEAARKHLEKTRWPDGPVCPHCGIVNDATLLESQTEGKRKGKTVTFKTHARTGTYKCRACGQQFSVTVGTIFEDSKIPLHKWLLAIHLMCSSKKGISALQLQRNLEIGSYRSAWFMAHRIRWALGQEPMATKLKGIVEIDEVWIGGKEKGPYARRSEDEQSAKELLGPSRRKPPQSKKTPVVAFLERDGKVRSVAMERVTGENVRPILKQFVEEGTHIMTDGANKLKMTKHGWKHSSVNHREGEYVRHDDNVVVTTNTVESYFAIIQRGIYGVYHHVGKQYLDQYLREFDFRYNVRRVEDGERSLMAIRKTGGKRLMLKEPLKK